MIHYIDAEGDPRIAGYRHVGDAVWLQRQNLFVAEGRLVVRRLIEAARFSMASILLTPASLHVLNDVVVSIGCEVYVSDQATLNGVTGFNFHRGCLALAHRAEPVHLDDLQHATRLLALEAIGNPDNIGGLFRTAAAPGAEGMLLDARSGDPLYRKAIRTSMAAVLQLPWSRLPMWPDDLESFRRNGFLLIALTPRPDAESINSFADRLQGHERLIVMVGAEGPGLSGEALALADHLVRIPITGVDSLNVTVAAGIALERLRGL